MKDKNCFQTYADRVIENYGNNIRNFAKCGHEEHNLIDLFYKKKK